MAAYACAVVWMLVTTPRMGWFWRVCVLGAMAWAVSYAEENLARIGISGSSTSPMRASGSKEAWCSPRLLWRPTSSSG